MKRYRGFAVGVILATLAACSAAQKDTANRTLNPLADRQHIEYEAGLERLSKTVCQELEKHTSFGPGQKYADETACVEDYKTTFAKYYSKDTCGKPHGFKTEPFKKCEERAQHWESSSNVFDLAGFLSACSAGKICE